MQVQRYKARDIQDRSNCIEFIASMAILVTSKFSSDNEISFQNIKYNLQISFRKNIAPHFL